MISKSTLVLALWLSPIFALQAAFAQFPSAADSGGPVAVGQAMAHKDDSGRVAIVQAPAVAPQGGGVIQLSAFGWLEPYVDSIVQALLGLGLAWLGKSKYTQWMDESSRQALESFTKNAASSLIADGFVKMENKAVTVHSAALAQQAAEASTRVPDALKRFGITPEVMAQKIIDAIPQTPAGAAIVAQAHDSANDPRPESAPSFQNPPPKTADWPPTTGSA